MSFTFDGPGRDQETTRKPVKINPKWDRLTQDAVRASNEGKTYGQLKAEQWEKERATRERLERERMERARMRAAEIQAKREAEAEEDRGVWMPKKEKKVKHCPQCGKVVTGMNRKYCDDWCKELFKREKKKAEVETA